MALRDGNARFCDHALFLGDVLDDVVIADCMWVAIVKDELENLAGGIEKTCARILPHVGSALVMDTGSSDGTVEALESIQREHAHLAIAHYDAPFTSFSKARNAMLQAALEVAPESVRYFLILDADESLDAAGWQALFDLTRAPSKCVCFEIQTCDSEQEKVHRSNSGMLNPRCFPKDARWGFVDQVGGRFERLMWDGEPIPREWMVRKSGVTLWHFVPGQRERGRKTKAYRKNFGEP